MKLLSPALWSLLLGGCGSLGYYGPPDGTPGDTADGTDPTGPTLPGDDDDDDDAAPPEICGNGADDDGDGASDCDDPDCDPTCDADGDGEIAVAFGGPDCDDGDPDVHSAGVEICDGIDNDCAGGVDDDQDGDGADACADCDDANPAVRPGAVEICNDGLDNDCVGGDCADFVADFEAGSIGPPWVATGQGPWSASTATAHGGAWAARSRTITHSQTTGMQVTLAFPAGGSLSFWHTGGTESGFDFLRFFVDGAERGAWSGSWPWTQTTWAVPPGTYVFEWRYTKDGSVNGGIDAVSVDDILALGGSP